MIHVKHSGAAAGDEVKPGGTARPLVDIGIPAFRRARYLAQAIESVVAQTLADWQLTVYDNGPAGGEIQEVTERYSADPRVRYAPSGHELPLAENWTRAIREGDGRYVALLNDDDRWHRDFLRRRVEALESHPECGLAFGEYVQIDEVGAEITRSPVRFPEGPIPRSLLAPVLMRSNIIAPPTLLVRRSAYNTVGAKFDPRFHYCDWEMWARLISRFDAYYVTECDSDFRRHPDTNTLAAQERPDRLLEMADHVEALLGRFQASSPGRLGRKRNRAHVLLHSASDVHQGGGWEASNILYRRALRIFPPAFFTYTSLWIIGTTILGHRGSRVAARLIAPVRGRIWPGHPHSEDKVGATKPPSV